MDIRERLEGARRVLASSAQAPTIAAVARSLGFSDPGHFARRFRAAYGLSPSEWQRIRRKT
ncbi:MAG: helix-turn-helix domain-containing protein [Pseudonocardiaceae bacterium]